MKNERSMNGNDAGNKSFRKINPELIKPYH